MEVGRALFRVWSDVWRGFEYGGAEGICRDVKRQCVENSDLIFHEIRGSYFHSLSIKFTRAGDGVSTFQFP